MFSVFFFSFMIFMKICLFGVFLLKLVNFHEIYNFSIDITERDGILLENIPIYSKVSVFDQICSFSVKLVNFLEIYNFSINTTERQCIPLENLIFSINFIKICGFHDFP